MPLIALTYLAFVATLPQYRVCLIEFTDLSDGVGGSACVRAGYFQRAACSASLAFNFHRLGRTC